MLCFYLQGTTASRQRHEQVLVVLHGQEQTLVQHMAGEEEAHMKQEDHVEEEAHVEEDGFEDDGGEKEEGAAQGVANSSRLTTGLLNFYSI
jgi:hypothetical protein